MKDDWEVVELLKKQEKNYSNGNFGRDSVGKWARSSFLAHWTLETLTGSCKSPRGKFSRSSKLDDQPSRAILRLCKHAPGRKYDAPVERSCPAGSSIETSQFLRLTSSKSLDAIRSSYSSALSYGSIPYRVRNASFLHHGRLASDLWPVA